MTERKAALGPFQKIGERLYRHSSKGVYYARIKTGGKKFRLSLATAKKSRGFSLFLRHQNAPRFVNREARIV